MLCEYGCGKEAKYKFKNGKFCCSKFWKQCDKSREKTSKQVKGKNHPMFGKVSPIRGRISPNKLTIEKIKKKYYILFKIEELRYNPDKPGEKEIQVHCKNHNCQNSKEQGGWFTPTYTQIYERYRAISFYSGFVENNFYCSTLCKESCILYKSRSDPFQDTKKPYTDSEYKQFRGFVLERDNYICQYCGKLAIHVHHEKPQKLEPFFSLDPDYAWSVCGKCHYEKGHKDECNTGILANKICKTGYKQ